MTGGRDFDVEPWRIGWSRWDPSGMARRESILSLANGHLGWRGTLDEGSPVAVGGAYLNGVFEQHPMPYAEGGYGYPERDESVINVPDGKVIRLTVGDAPFDVREGRLARHEQQLDLRDGILRREVDWTSAAGARVQVSSARLVSLTHHAVAAVSYEVRAVDDPVDITIQSEIVVGEPLPDVHPDRRVMDALNHALRPAGGRVIGRRATLVHSTRESGIQVALAMEHVLDAVDAMMDTEIADDLARATVTARLAPGDRIRIVKFLGHEWSGSAAAATVRDRADAAVADAVRRGWDALVEEQRRYLADFWHRADVIVEGSATMQQAVRFALFHLLQSSTASEVHSIPGKGLTGPGYQGHVFWDAETFVLPVLSYFAPDRARAALTWRHATLGHARRRARQLHLDGAAFPWRTVDGRECSGYWPAGTAAFHINADIAAAVTHYVRVTGDAAFERDAGLELLVETARLWMSLGHWDGDGVFHIDGVTGPDEYSALVNDNLYTNLLARKNLRAAAGAARRHPGRLPDLGVTEDEVGRWMATADAVAVPYDRDRRVHQQAAGFTRLQRWDFDATPAAGYPLQDHYSYFELYRRQVIKQADLVLALQFASDAFSPDETARAFSYYEELTVRDSSVSASAQAVVAARVGHLLLAYDYLSEAASIDLLDLRDDLDGGLHLASLAGIWTAVTAGFGGMRWTEDGLAFAPRLVAPLTRIAFTVRISDSTLRVEIAANRTTYTLEGPSSVSLSHFGDRIALDPDTPQTVPTPPLPDPGPTPSQPRGRSPREIVAHGEARSISGVDADVEREGVSGG